MSIFDHMATNKHAILRYRTIDRCLRDLDRQWTWRELAEACAKEIQRTTGAEITISQRTIKYDLRAMRSNEVLGYFAPIDYDRKEKTYYYTDPKYRLSERPINQDETDNLKNAISMLSQFMELSEATGIQNVLTKLEDRLDRRSKDHERIIQFDHEQESPGQQWLYQLYQLIKSHTATSIMYHPFRKEAAYRVVSPQLLKEYRSRWYLLAHDHKSGESRVFALDRIKEMRETFSQYVERDPTTMRRYFDQVVGVSVLEDEVQEVQIEVYGVQLDYFKTKPLHPSQQIISEQEDIAVIQLHVIVNYELVSELLSYRDRIKVISPTSLKQALLEELDDMRSIYT